MLPLNVKLRQLPSMDSPCWEWQLHRDKDGYGILKFAGRNNLVHRLMYRLYVGKLQNLQLVMHRCDNPACCNPEHLFRGTVADNNADCNRKFRHTFGVLSKNAKLNDCKVLELRNEYREGKTTISEMSRRHSIPRSTLNNAVFGQHWKHVEGACQLPKR